MNAENSLSSFTADQLRKFNAIEPHTYLYAEGKENDFLVGEAKKGSLKFAKGTTTHFRDIVILGDFSIECDEPSPEALTTIIARDIILAGNINIRGMYIEGNFIYQPKK